VAQTARAEAVVLRSLRYGEADRILHLFTKELGRVGAIAKGARKTRSRFGARLEPFAHVELQLHHGRGELATVTGADLIRSHQGLGADPYRLGAGQIGLEAVLRLFIEHDSNPAAFHALVRFVDLLDEPGEFRATTPAHDPLVLSFQLKLLWLAGYLPHLAGCAGCGSEGPLVGFSPAAGGAVCADCADGALRMSPEGFAGTRSLLERTLAEARDTGLSPRAARETLAMIESVYEYHGGFRMRTLARRGAATQ
jgi:DNA repair protein RecO (recombination protein O)